MPVIRVEMFKGRTVDQKRQLVKELTDAFIRTCGGTPESVQIVITDVAKEDWGGAGILMSDKYPDKK
ncbi:4-oxalocrotonate tautomerase [Taklimakanibacter albus]|uniref:4-oxalocrotonate tautomerase n=1 Tax=Taklimakanibacter albus TaxID=2800327 RepID=A0ACC5RFF3_9HYPH|nr:4-oxalocrotonate tautomerase [Aestuariivirga sp. YIM B02566]MBK1871374.1 4-oxalocrotonate tautomerase [Aestuariivirga sp. YIM B02566]